MSAWGAFSNCCPEAPIRCGAGLLVLAGEVRAFPGFHRSRVFRGVLAARSFSIVRRSKRGQGSFLSGIRSSLAPASKTSESPSWFGGAVALLPAAVFLVGSRVRM